MIVEPGPAGVLPLAERRGCPSEIREGPGAQAFKIIPLPLWRVSRSHPVVQAACDFEVSWPVANTAFTAAAEAALPMDTPPVTHLGIDGTRRGKARFRLVEAPDGGEICEVVADRWHVGLVDLVGGAGWSRSTCAPCSKPRCATRCRTSARGWPQILAAITTGVTNAASEGINRAIKTDAVHLYANLRERVVSQVSPNPDREIHKGFI